MVKQKSIYKVISLFSGCGGMDLGFIGGFELFGKRYHKLPFEIVYAADINKQAIQTYNHNFNHLGYVEDISEINLNKLPKADIVIGGFPCQPFSIAGKREGFKDEKGRGNLYLQMKNVIEHVKPKMFIAENVDGLRTHKVDGKSALDEIIEDFEQIGYDVEYKILKAVEYGVPQTRVRIIIIGKKKKTGGTILFPKPTHADTKTSRLKAYRTTADAIGDLEHLINSETAPTNHTDKDYSKAKFQPGKNHQGNQKEDANKPAHTVRAEAHGNQYAHYNSTGEDPNSEDTTTWRRLTVRECARIQTFPDKFNFPLSQSAAHRQIGNAVPPVLAWYIAKNVANSLHDMKTSAILKSNKSK